MGEYEDYGYGGPVVSGGSYGGVYAPPAYGAPRFGSRTGGDEDFKAFCGGISWDSTKESLQAYFEQFGPVTDVKIVLDRTTGKSRGFGFVTFATQDARDAALQRGDHTIDGRSVQTKPVTPRGAGTPMGRPQQWPRPAAPAGTLVPEKIFVGGLSRSTTEQEFQEYFEQFGPVTEVTIVRDRETGTPRGFGFVTFSSPEPVSAVLTKKYHELCGKDVEVKAATNRVRRPPTAMQQRPYGGQSYYGGAPNAAAYYAPAAGYAPPYGGYSPPSPAQQAVTQYFLQQAYYAPSAGAAANYYMNGGAGAYNYAENEEHEDMMPQSHEGTPDPSGRLPYGDAAYGEYPPEGDAEFDGSRGGFGRGAPAARGGGKPRSGLGQ